MSTAINCSLAFAGRDKELTQLRSLYAQRRHVLICGPQGIGKSALVNQVRFRAPLLFCEDTAKLSRICGSLERQFGWTHSQLSVMKRKNRLLSYIEKRGEAVAFDQVGEMPPRIAHFVARLREYVPVWIVCRSELPHDIGGVWEHISDFVRVHVLPLKKVETRMLIAQAVSKGTIRAEALDHTASLYKLSKGSPRLLEEIIIELSSQHYKTDTSFGRCLVAISRRIQEFEIEH